MADTATLVFKVPTLVKLGSIVIDASVQERHTAASEVTQHPVEDGAPITDHSRPQPRRLSLTGLIAGSPLRETGGVVPLTPGQAFEELVRIKDTAETLSVVTALVTYENMVIESVTTTRDGESGDSLRFDAELLQIRKAKTIERVVRVRTANARTKGVQDLGPKPKAPTKLEAGQAMKAQAKSWLTDLVDMDSNTSEVPRGLAGIPTP